VQLWYDAIKSEISESTHTEGADDLIQALRAKPQIARMAANPLLLTIIVLMHWRGVKLPSRRVQVYQNATDTLIEYWTAQRGVAELDAEEVKGILAPIAHYILSSNVAGVIAHQDLLPRFYEGIAAQRGCDQATAKRIGRQILRNLNEQSGLFLERGSDANGQPVYGFLHQTFGEYLAALCLAEEMQSGEFALETYIYRSMWHEPLLLMAGHLSIYSKPQANALLRDILDFPTPYEKVLQRNLLLAAGCLADDIHVQPRLRDEVLEKLAELLGHDAPQVREAALKHYQRLAVTRHLEAALAALNRAYLLDGSETLEAPATIRLSLATALIHLGERATAQPVLWSLEEERRYRDEIRRLRFEYWPEHAIDYLLQLHADTDVYFPITAGLDLAGSTLGPMDAGLARRVLGEAGLRTLIEALMGRVRHEADQAALRWLATLTPEAPSVEDWISLTTPDTPAQIRRLAATRLLDGEHRAAAVTVLQDLVQNEPDEAPAAAQALLEAGEAAHLNRELLRDTALMANDYRAPQAIVTLLSAGDEAIALSAALHLLATCHPQQYLDGDPLWTVVESLIEHGHAKVGLAAAHWLALRPGYWYRIQACEALLEAGHVERAIPLLQYLAYECHDETSQRACERLLILREAQRVVPLLTRVAHLAAPSLRYQACLALALAHHTSLQDNTEIRGRSELKMAILSDRTQAYQAALHDFCQIGLEALDALDPIDNQDQAAQALGRFGLQWLAKSVAISDATNELASLTDSPWPAINANVALFDLRAGQVNCAQQRLLALLAEPDQSLSLPVRLQALKMLGRIIGPETTALLIQALEDKNSHVRRAAASALGGLGDPAAVQPLIVALGDKDSDVHWSAASALGGLGDPAAVQPLIVALGDKASDVRWFAASALGNLGNPTAVQPLIVALSDKASDVRWSAARALGNLGNPTAVQPLIVALSDKASDVRRAAARALRELGDPAAVQPLIVALSDKDSDVRRAAVYALRELGNSAVPSLRAALGDKDSGVRVHAAHFLGRLGDLAVAPLLIAALGDEASDVRSAAAGALGELGDPAAVQPLLVTLNDKDSNVRVHAAEALGELGDPTVVQPLFATFSDENSDVRESVARALGRLGDPAAVHPLIAALGDENSNVRWSAASVLGKLHDAVAVQPLLTALNDEAPPVRESAARSLGVLGEPAAVPSLIVALSDEFSWVRRSAAESLGQLGTAVAISSLIVALGDEESDVRRSAAIALSQLRATGVTQMILATPVIEGFDYWADQYEAHRHTVALVHLDPAGALVVLDRYAWQFRRESWVERLHGQALWRLGELDTALASLKEAVEKEDNNTNRLALAHFYLEQGDLQAAGEHMRHALEEAPRRAINLLSQAVLLWELGQAAEALEKLAQAQRRERRIACVKDLQYEHFWGPKALAALEAMLAQLAASEV